MSARLKIHGDVSTVLQGEVAAPPYAALKNFSFALGGGRFSDPDFYGETLIWDHKAYGTIIKKGKVVTESAEESLQTPFLLGIFIEEEPPQKERCRALSIQDLYARKTDAAFVGCCRFSKLDVTYLKRSPIHHENILENQELYWEVEQYTDQYAYLFGVVLSKALPQAFYQNPGEARRSSVVSHTHIALTDQPPRFQKFSRTKILGVRHLLTQSVLKEGLFSIYKTESLL